MIKPDKRLAFIGSAGATLQASGKVEATFDNAVLRKPMTFAADAVGYGESMGTLRD